MFVSVGVGVRVSVSVSTSMIIVTIIISAVYSVPSFIMDHKIGQSD